MTKKTSIIEYDRVEDDLRIVIKFNQLGHRCGYVGIQKNNPLFGLDYTKIYEVEEMYYPHGGITFSGLFDDDNWWYFGFDCAHYGDARDIDTLEKYTEEGLFDPLPFKFPLDVFCDSSVKTFDYVLAECEKFAKAFKEKERGIE